MATLLIVDDDTNIREVLQELFTHHKHECHTADRAEQALAYLELETYDVVITDIAMPGLGGAELIRQVQKKAPATPVIVISGVADQIMARKLLEMGAFAFFTKPYELDELEETVNRAIARRRQALKATQPQQDPTADSSEKPES